MFLIQISDEKYKLRLTIITTSLLCDWLPAVCEAAIQDFSSPEVGRKELWDANLYIYILNRKIKIKIQWKDNFTTY